MMKERMVVTHGALREWVWGHHVYVSSLGVIFQIVPYPLENLPLLRSFKI
jgi:hypothetical protein